MLRRISRYNNKFSDWQDNNPNSHSIMLRDFIRAHSQAEDVIHYRKLVLSGNIYEFFGDKLQERGIIQDCSPKLRRKLAKKELFRAFFDRNQAIGYADSYGLRLFKELFPNVYKIFSRIKSGKHATLACALQNLEAEIVLFKTCGELADIHDDLPLLTIHDSIATYPECISIVKETLARNIAEAIGAFPQIKVEHWNSSLLTTEPDGIIRREEPPRQNGAIYGYVSDEPIPQFNWSLKAAAKKVGISPKKIHALLREKEILQSDRRLHNLPFEQYIEAGYFTVVERCHRGAGLIRTTKVTSAGISFLQMVLDGESS